MTKGIITIENYNEGLIKVNNGFSTEDLIQDWINHCHVNPLTQKSYNSAASSFVNFIRDNSYELGEKSFIAYQEYCKQALAISTARLYCSVAKTFCSWICKRSGKPNFTDGIKNIALDDKSEHVRDGISVEDCAKLVDTFKAKNNFAAIRDRLICLICASCGLRVKEIRFLDCNDVIKKHNRLYLRVFGKARAGKIDVVPLPKELSKMIENYLDERKKEFGEFKDSDALFFSLSRRNKFGRLTTRSISRLIVDALVAAGLREPTKKKGEKESKTRRREYSPICAHSLRHGFAQNCLQLNQGDIFAVSRTLRHRDTKVTYRYLADLDSMKNNSCDLVFNAIISKLE